MTSIKHPNIIFLGWGSSKITENPIRSWLYHENGLCWLQHNEGWRVETLDHGLLNLLLFVVIPKKDFNIWRFVMAAINYADQLFIQRSIQQCRSSAEPPYAASHQKMYRRLRANLCILVLWVWKVFLFYFGNVFFDIKNSCCFQSSNWFWVNSQARLKTTRVFDISTNIHSCFLGKGADIC